MITKYEINGRHLGQSGRSKKIFVIILYLLLENKKQKIYITNTHIEIKQTVIYFSGTVFNSNIKY